MKTHEIVKCRAADTENLGRLRYVPIHLREHFLELPHVRDVHDLHVSQIATGLPVLTAHVVVDESCFKDGHAPKMLDELQQCVAEHFDVSIEHSTFQLETPEHGIWERRAERTQH